MAEANGRPFTPLPAMAGLDMLVLSGAQSMELAPPVAGEEGDESRDVASQSNTDNVSLVLSASDDDTLSESSLSDGDNREPTLPLLQQLQADGPGGLTHHSDSSPVHLAPRAAASVYGATVMPVNADNEAAVTVSVNSPRLPPSSRRTLASLQASGAPSLSLGSPRPQPSPLFRLDASESMLSAANESAVPVRAAAAVAVAMRASSQEPACGLDGSAAETSRGGVAVALRPRRHQPVDDLPVGPELTAAAFEYAAAASPRRRVLVPPVASCPPSPLRSCPPSSRRTMAFTLPATPPRPSSRAATSLLSVSPSWSSTASTLPLRAELASPHASPGGASTLRLARTTADEW